MGEALINAILFRTAGRIGTEYNKYDSTIHCINGLLIRPKTYVISFAF